VPQGALSLSLPQSPFPHSTDSANLSIQCHDWVKLLSVKNIDAIVPELIWWKVRLSSRLPLSLVLGAPD